MTRNMLVGAILCMASFSVTAQKNVVFINSGEILKSAQTAYDSGNYQASIAELLKIHERDTNYVASLSQLAYSYVDNKEFDKAIEIAEKALKEKSVEDRTDAIVAKGLALARKGELEKAVNLFNSAIEEYPTKFVLIYHLGNVYYNNKDYNKARDCFFRVLTIAPFHSYSHLNLGAIAMKVDQKVHALLSYGTYLAINENDNSRLVILEKFVTNQLKNDEQNVQLNNPNAFDKLDQIIRAGIANDKSFKSVFPMNAGVIRQFELFFQQIDLNSKDEADPWLKYYLPVYKRVAAEGNLEPFMYHILSSSAFDEVKKWKKKNEKTLTAFFNTFNQELRTKRVNAVLPEKYAGMRAWYNSEGKFAGIGKLDKEDKPVGPWKYYNDGGVRIAEGIFGSADKKSGVWKYYDEFGNLKKTEDQESGEVTGYYADGTKRNHYFIKSDKVEGPVEIYHPCGVLAEKLTYKNDAPDGSGETFYPNGKTKNRYTYVAGKLTGEYLTYYPTGELKSKYIQKAGLAEGPYVEYFKNGKVAAEGNYVADELQGLWKYYYENGKLKSTGNYAKSNGVGEWKYYDLKGLLTEVRPIDNGGVLEGENKFFDGENLYAVFTYKKGVLVQTQYFDRNKKEVGKFGSKDGSFQFKTFYPNGDLKSEGTFKKGEYEGPFKYYFHHGGLSTQYNYKNGKREGKMIEYYASGKVKSEGTYSNDELGGFFQFFYQNGQVQAEGYYANGKREQQWMGYYSDGTKDYDNYYLNDVQYHKNYDFCGDGKLLSCYKYDKEGLVEDIAEYNNKGENALKQLSENHRKIYENRYKNGKVGDRIETLCGSFYQQIDKRTPDGTKYLSMNLVNNLREGKYQYNDFTGAPVIEGGYENGNTIGVWKWYHASGKPETIGRYFQNEGDSIWTHYYPSGEIASLIPFGIGERDGVAKYFAPDGTPMVEKEWAGDELIAYREMTATGAWGEWKKFRGEALLTAYYSNGKKSYEEQYKNGALNGIKRIYLSNGKTCQEHNAVNGEYHGPFFTSYSNGTTYRKGVYSSDELHGKVEYFNPDGTPLKSEEYVNGMLHGKAISYKNKVKVKEVNYFGGEPNE